MHRKETSMKKVLKIADAIMIILIIPVLMKNILISCGLKQFQLITILNLFIQREVSGLGI